MDIHEKMLINNFLVPARSYFPVPNINNPASVPQLEIKSMWWNIWSILIHIRHTNISNTESQELRYRQLMSNFFKLTLI